jgi:glycosyltransferase involved in cell wall biosynthesis
MNFPSNHSPLVSLLVANYNNGKFIAETLQSAVNQTYRQLEIIVVDDASDDNSVVIIKDFIHNHPDTKIELYKNFSNYGCGRNKRKCIDIARGEYFAFLDPEDTITPNAVEELLEIHLKNQGKYSIVYSSHYLCNEKLEPQSLSTWVGKIPDGQSHLTSSGGHISAFALCSKAFYDRTLGINPAYIVAEDHDLYYKMEETAPVFFLDKPLYYYRKHDNNLSWDYNMRYRNLYWLHQADLSAYKRRKRNTTQAKNLTIHQMNKRKFDFYMQHAKYYRMQRKYTKSLVYNLMAMPFIYTLFIK